MSTSDFLARLAAKSLRLRQRAEELLRQAKDLEERIAREKESSPRRRDKGPNPDREDR